MADILQPCARCDGEGITPSKAYVAYRNVGEKWKAEFDKSNPLRTCPLCNGDGELFYIGEEKERFNMLVDRWERDTMHLSSLETNHPCFITMDKMKSQKAIVWLLERMQKEPTHLMCFLQKWVKKEDSPITDEIRGHITKITEAWINWGKKKKLI